MLDIRTWKPHKISPLVSKNTQIPRWGRPKHRFVRPVNQALEKTESPWKTGILRSNTQRRKKVFRYLVVHLVENSQLFGFVTAVKRIVAIVPVCHDSPPNKCRLLFLNCCFGKWPSWTKYRQENTLKKRYIPILKNGLGCISLNTVIVHSVDGRVYLTGKLLWKLKVFKL